MKLREVYAPLLEDAASRGKQVEACRYYYEGNTLYVSNICVMSIRGCEADTSPEPLVGGYKLMQPSTLGRAAIRAIVQPEGMTVNGRLIQDKFLYGFMRAGTTLYMLKVTSADSIKDLEALVAYDIPDGHPLMNMPEGDVHTVKPMLNQAMRQVEASLLARSNGIVCLLFRQKDTELLIALMRAQLRDSVTIHYGKGAITVSLSKGKITTKEKGFNMPKVNFPQFTLPPTVKPATATATKAQEQPLPVPPQAEEPVEEPVEQPVKAAPKAPKAAPKAAAPAPVEEPAAEAPAQDPVKPQVQQALPDALAFIESLKGAVTVATREDAVQKLEQVSLIVAALKQLASWLNLTANAEKRFVQKGIAKSPLSEYTTPELLAELGRRAGK